MGENRGAGVMEKTAFIFSLFLLVPPHLIPTNGRRRQKEEQEKGRYEKLKREIL